MFNNTNRNPIQHIALNDNDSNSNNETTPDSLLQNYLIDNPKTGYLVFQVFQDSTLKGRLPVANAKITVSKLLGEDYYFSRVLMTDENGKTDIIPLPTVSAELSRVPGNGNPYSTYNATIEAENFSPTTIYEIPIFENITSIQPINLLPITLVPIYDETPIQDNAAQPKNSNETR